MAGNKVGGLKAQETNKERYGKDFYKRLGKIGGKTHNGKNSAKTMYEKYGADYYSKIGKKGGAGRHRKKSFRERWYDMVEGLKK